ncbi:MAG: extracellular solute-binding protein, partial [Chloroflexota bacterium]
APMVATSEAYAATHPDVHIHWERRTLSDFAEMSLPELALRYDLIVLDHPWIGGCVAKGSLLPLDPYLDAAFLSDQVQNGIGRSHASYHFHGQQWALAIDAAAQVSAYRPDLLAQLDVEVPQTWDEVIMLGQRLRRQGMAHVTTPLLHIDCFPCFFTLCANAGEQAFTGEAVAVSRPVGRHVLGMMRTLMELGHPAAINWNPPKVLDEMSTGDEIVYCPLLFGYSNYARTGYRDHIIRFTNIPADPDDKPRGAILGGGGLAISSGCKNPEAAADYAAFVASSSIQSGMYFDSGGQPGYRGAWLSGHTNAVAGNFFGDTLATLDLAAMRPRYDGWISVQDHACQILHQFLTENGNPDRTLDTLDEAYRQSLAVAHPRGQV